jgi:hypothetical protein
MKLTGKRLGELNESDLVCWNNSNSNHNELVPLIRYLGFILTTMLVITILIWGYIIVKFCISPRGAMQHWHEMRTGTGAIYYHKATGKETSDYI